MTIEKQVGWLRELVVEPLGSALVEDAPIGATVLYVNDSVDFDESGGVLQLGEEQIGYSTTDPDLDTIILNGPLAIAAEVDDFVAVWDTDNAATATDMLGLVELLNTAGDDDPIPAKLTHSLSILLQLGPREGRGERVWVEQDGNNWTIVDLIGKSQALDLAGADPDSLPGGVKPKAPTGLIVTASTFTDAGVTRGRISAAWAAVTENVDDEELAEDELTSYEVQVQEGTGGAGVWMAGAVTNADTTSVTMGTFTVAATYAVRVRSTTAKTVSDWSEVESVTIAADGTAPGKPSTPGATSRLGVHTLTWDGKDWLGQPMPADFAYAELHRSTTTGFTATPGDLTTLVYRYAGAGKFNLPGTYNVTDYFVLIAVDTSGNASVQSNQATSITKPLVDVTNFPDSAMNELYARTGHFINVTTDMLEANSVTADKADLGLLTALLVRGAQMETHAGLFRGVKTNDDGIKAYDSSGSNPTPTFQVDAVTGSVTARGEWRTADSGQRIVISPAGRVYAYDSSGNLGTLYLSSSAFIFDRLVRANSIVTQDIDSGGTSTDLSLTGRNIYLNNITGSVQAIRLHATQFSVGAMQSGIDMNGNNLSQVGTVLASGEVHTNRTGTSGGFIDDVWIDGGSTGATINNNGRIIRTPSSQRYKKSIEPLELHATSVRDIESVTFEWIDADTYGGGRHPGVIAEQAEHAGLAQFVTYDGDGHASGFRYPEFATAAVITVAKEVLALREMILTHLGLPEVG